MDWLVEWGYVGLFIGAFISATILPLSSEVFLVALLTRSGVDPYIAIGSATMGSWLGGLTTYYVGYLGNWEWIERWLRISHDKLIAQQSKIRRWGSLLALMVWTPFIGDVLAVALGFYRVDFRSTAIYMLIGKGARYIVWALIYYLVR